MTKIPGMPPGLTRSLLRGEDPLAAGGPKLPAHLTNSPLGAIAYAAAQTGYGKAQAWWKTRRTWTVTVSGDDELFYDAQLWLMDQGGDQTRKALAAKTYWVSNPMGPGTSELRFLADDDTPQDMEIKGHTISVYVDDNDGQAHSSQQQHQQGGMSLIKPPKLVFSAKSQQGRDAVLALLREIREARVSEKRTPGLMVLDRWGDWRRRADLPARPLDSVIVKGTVIDDLFSDLEEFIGQEADYVRRAIPYHRAYLLVGPPGTGKTSAVKAVTNALGLDLWYAQLSGIDKDAKLADVFGDVRARGVLLLEDIDSLPAAIDRTGEDAPEGDISTSGLLNALDGVATPHGLISIMTTNHPEHLDPALMRPGRIDRVFAFEFPDSPTIHRHFQFFYGQHATYYGDWPEGRSSAAVSEIFKRHMHEPHAAEEALLRPPTEEEERGWQNASPASFSGRPGPAAPSGGRRPSRARSFTSVDELLRDLDD
jgi:hypothetical protein